MKVLFGSYLVCDRDLTCCVYSWSCFCSKSFGTIWNVVLERGSFHNDTCECYLSGEAFSFEVTLSCWSPEYDTM